MKYSGVAEKEKILKKKNKKETHTQKNKPLPKAKKRIKNKKRKNKQKRKKRNIVELQPRQVTIMLESQSVRQKLCIAKIILEKNPLNLHKSLLITLGSQPC